MIAFLVTGNAVWTHDSVAQCLRYSIDIVPGPDCGFLGAASFANGVNEIGDLTGGYTPCGESANGNSIWLGQGGWITLPTPPLAGQRWQYLIAMNSSRRVAGTIAPVGMTVPRRAACFDFPNSSFIDIGMLPGFAESEAYAINEDGWVCGYMSGPGLGLRSFLWRDGRLTLLDLPLGPNSIANDVSNSGSICGLMGSSPFLGAHAFIWNSGKTIDLGTIFPGSIGAVATGVNEFDNVCGNSNFDDPIYVYIRRGFLWSDGVAQDLGMLPGLINCIPNSINDLSIIVGHCTGEFAGSDAFVWSDGVMHKLADLIPGELNLHITNATAINNSGQISATGILENGAGDTVALRLNPIPPLVADLNCDWQVNSFEILEVIRNWGQCPPNSEDPTQAPPFAPPLCPTDLNEDGRVNVPDLLMVINHWSPSPV